MIQNIQGEILCEASGVDFQTTITRAKFENLSDDMINLYVQNYKPLDKAGSYGIQELPDGFIKNVDGSLENIIGLCSSALTEVLNSFN